MKKISYEVIKPVIYSEELRNAYLSRSVTGKSLMNKTVLITGATGGIGIAMTKRFLCEGCKVIVTGRNIEKNSKAMDELAKHYPKQELVKLEVDLLNPKCGVDLVYTLDKQNYKVDILINNAGLLTDVDKKRLFRDVTEEQFRKVWNTNYLGTKLISTAIADNMVMNNCFGTIINIASICAFFRNFQYTPYGMSKSAVIQLTEEMRLDYPSLNIISLAPGSVATRMGDLEVGCNIAKKIGVLKRVAIPEEIAALTAFLSSDIGKSINNPSVYASGCEVL